jgi:hypothetical protein
VPVTVGAESLTIGDRTCSIVDDVIILADIDLAEPDKKQAIDSFGREWESFSDRKPEHEKEWAEKRRAATQTNSPEWRVDES